MIPANNLTKMHYINSPDLTPAIIKKYKKATKEWLKSVDFDPDVKNSYEIPWDLIFIPDYQIQRAIKAENDKSIDNIIANWDDNRDTPGIVNLRTDGPYAGLLFMVDGYHRSRYMERTADQNGYEGAWDIIISTDYNEENLVFADQCEGVTKLSSISRYKAWLANSNMDNRNIAAAHLLNDILTKYHMDTAIEGAKGQKHRKLAITAAHRICLESLVNKGDIFDWIIEILSTSGVYQTAKGLSADMLNSLKDLYYMLIEGKFGNVSPSDVKPILIEKLHHHTWGTIQDLGIAIQKEDPVHVKETYQVSRARIVFGYWICKAFNLKSYETK